MAKNNNLQDFTRDIANTIRQNEGSSSAINPQDFSDKINALANKDTSLPFAMPVTIKTLQMKSGSMNVPITPNIRIMDADFRSWSVEDWHAAARARNFNKEGVAAPIGFDITAWGKHFCYIMKSKWMDAVDYTPKVYYTGQTVRDANTGKVYQAKMTTSSTWVSEQWEEIGNQFEKNYYDVSGSQIVNNGGLRHSAWQHTMDQFANGATKGYTIGSTTVSGISTPSGDTITLSTSNSPFKWTIKKGLSFAYSFETDNAKDRYEALLAFTEFYRTLAALKTDITTSEEDGTIGTVTILNSSGTRPTPATDDMYFYINGVNTGLLAKYNPTGNAAAQGIFAGDNLTSGISETIYTAQKNNGVTMNDDYASLSSGATKVVVTEGAKGAEAYAYGGYWYITTPAISRANANLTADYNIPDSPALSYVEWMKGLFGRNDIYMPDERMLLSIKNNRPTCLNTLLTYLNSTNGDAWGMQGFPTEYVWSPVRFYAYIAWNVILAAGNVVYYSVNYRYVACGAFAL